MDVSLTNIGHFALPKYIWMIAFHTLTHHIKERFANNLNLTSQCRKSLKGPKKEIFVARIFTQIRPVWLDDLKTRPKSSKSLWWGPYIYLFVGEIFI
jgi:hypothetical protein